MPRYFIDTDDGDQIHHDTTGHDLPDTETARKTALDAPPDMARDESLIQKPPVARVV